jgi:acetoin utilization deacetylase AcuC-like enzyme
MPAVRAFHSDRYVLPLPQGHRFPMPKYALLKERVLALPGLELLESPAASDGELALAHEPGYVSAVADGTLSLSMQREIGFPWSERMVERARRSVGATIAAARAALTDGLAANLAGGTHHAMADKGGGYCVFNDVAVAARLMQAEWHRRRGTGPASLLRIAVIDLDVHQGNGTASIFRDDPTVFTLSLHGAKNFPFRKEPSDLDVELPDGCTDAPYLDALDAALAQLWQRHGESPPGLVFYLAGADPHEGDRLGRLKLTHAGLVERDRRVFTACRERGIPVAISMAGGYGRDIADSVTVHENTLREAVASWRIGMEQCAHERTTAA